VAVLEQLALHHELPGLILSYRQLSKLKSTYVDALPVLVRSKTGRIHTSFNQAVTATGRLSSSDPNLQNIPIRTPLGREIRRAFIADPGNLLLSADYSQIELRILAHFSEDKLLLEAFSKDEDVHCKTATEIFDVPHEAVTSEMRRVAKTVNFGIIYGLSPYGLARDLSISQKEARELIEGYFSRYRGVREYLDRTIQEAYQQGYVTTLCQRRRYLPDLCSKSRNVREVAERTAINTPVQGSAADLIKLSMLRIQHEMRRKGLSSKMTLQVHDELLFEVPQAEVPQMTTLVQEEMETVAELKVPLVVIIALGQNWGEMKPVAQSP
jgi:DNA polymerase-1